MSSQPSAASERTSRPVPVFHDANIGSYPSTPLEAAADDTAAAAGAAASSSERERKPSYVGLSNTLSGYSPSNRYSPSDRKVTPPAQIPVSSNPQTLDSVSLVRNLDLSMRNGVSPVGSAGSDVVDRAASYASSHTRKIIQTGESTTIETTTKFYSSGSSAASRFRDTASPYNGSDSGAESTGSGPFANGGTSVHHVNNNSSSNGLNNNGNLVQRQIERLYGSKISTVRRSPEVEEENSNRFRSNGGPKSGGFFTNRFGNEERSNGRNGDSSNGSDPLEFKPLKVPAVFRLLRPEFREQLKTTSCLIPNDQTSPPPKKPTSRTTTPERIIPIQTAASKAANKSSPSERIIPIVRETKKVTPATPTNGTTNGVEKPVLAPRPAVRSPPKTPENGAKERLESSPLSSPSLTRSATEMVKDFEKATDALEAVKLAEPIPEEPETAELEAEAEAEAEIPDFDPTQYETVGGVKERAFLGTILEEDNESTASGSQLNLNRSLNGGSAIKAATNGAANGAAALATDPVPAEEVKDGHYYMKVGYLVLLCSTFDFRWERYFRNGFLML